MAEALSHPENLPLSHKDEVPEPVRIPGGKMLAADPKDHTAIFWLNLTKYWKNTQAKARRVGKESHSS